VALFTFGSHAPAPDDPPGSGNNANRPLTAVSTAEGAGTVKTWIDGITVPNPHQATNWDRGLMQVAQSADRFDVVIVVTDGNPTRYGEAALGTGILTRFVELEGSIFSANTVKTVKEARIIAVGVGDGAKDAGDNFAAISGPDHDDPDARLNDYFQAKWTEAAGVLREVALAGCSSTVTVVKQVVPKDNPAGDASGAKAAGGFEFTVGGTPDVTPSPTSLTTDQATGAASATITFADGVNTGQLSFRETANSHFNPFPVDPGAKHAVCVDLATDPPAPLTVTNGGSLEEFTVDVARGHAVSCTVYNQPHTDEIASIQDAKKWVIQQIDDATPTPNVIGTASFDDPGQPGGFTAGLKADLELPRGSGTLELAPMTWAAPYGGLLADTEGHLVESPDPTPSGCTPISASVTGEPAGDGVMQSISPVAIGSYDLKLGAGLNLYQVTNTVQCHTQLSLYKALDRDEAPAPLSTDWLLTASPPAATTGALPAFSGVFDDTTVPLEPVTGDVTPGVPYLMTESDAHPEYVQYEITPAQYEPMKPGASGSWLCELADAAGNIFNDPSAFLAEGMTGAVSVPYGGHVHCFAANLRALLTVTKAVDGGTAPATAWTYTATPIGSVPTGLQPLAGLAAETPGTIRPAQTYRISEDAGGPANYTFEKAECTWDDPSGEVRTATFTAPPEISVAQAGHASCAFTNKYTAPTTTPPATTPPPGTASPPPSGTLPLTGARGAGPMAFAALVLVAAGAGAAAASRRRARNLT
jgi:hypothetical protein